MDRVVAEDSRGIDSQNFFESILIDVAISIQNSAKLTLSDRQWNYLRFKMLTFSALHTTFEIGGFICFFSKPNRMFTMTHVETNKHQTLYIYYSCQHNYN